MLWTWQDQAHQGSCIFVSGEEPCKAIPSLWSGIEVLITSRLIIRLYVDTSHPDNRKEATPSLICTSSLQVLLVELNFYQSTWEEQLNINGLTVYCMLLRLGSQSSSGSQNLIQYHNRLVTIPGVNKLGIACKKTISAVNYCSSWIEWWVAPIL